MLRWVMLGVFLLASSPVASFAEEVKLGYVDLQRALNETEDGRKAKANLKKVFDQKQKELDEQQELSAKEQEATGKIFERMNRIISKIAQAENFTMIFDKTQSAVLFAKPHLDLTNELIRRYNSGEGADKAGGPTAAAP